MPEKSRPSPPSPLMIAAQSLAAQSGVAVTAIDVVRDRAFRHYAEPLRQYLALRFENVHRASFALEEMRKVAAGWPQNQMVEDPGPRARLFRLAREMALGMLEADDVPSTAQRAPLPWRTPHSGAPTGYGAVLARVRSGLEREDAELLELRYARELSPEELSFVLDEELERLEGRLDKAERRARSLLDERGASASLKVSSVVLEAFALNVSTTPSDFDDAASEREPLERGIVLGGRYEIQARVGSGASGDVYRAVDTEVPGHVVALKLLHRAAPTASSRSAALRELRLIASVFHPSVVQFKDHGWFSDRLWFVMPWYEGESLEARIKRRPLSRAEARRVFEPLAQALAAMHAAGIRHQDVKPDNVFLARVGGEDASGEPIVVPVLLDFGVAAQEAETLLAGTPLYFAPEVAAQFAAMQTPHAVSMKADVFSLALTLRNALEPETQEDVPAAAVQSFIRFRAEHLPPMPVREDLLYLVPSFRRWLSEDPEKRPDAAGFARELGELTQPEERRARRNGILRWLVPTLTALAVFFGSVVFMLEKNARLKELEAERARIDAADARADLSVENARQVALKAHNEELLARYESSRLTRQQLARELATVETQVRVLRDELSAVERRSRALRDELTTTATAKQATEAALGQSQQRERELGAALEASRARVQDLSAAIATAETLAERRLQEAQRLRGDLETTTATLRETQERVQRIDAERARAEEARQSAEADLADLRRRVARLQDALDAIGDRPTAPSDPTPAPAPAP